MSERRFKELDADDRIWWGPTGDNRPGIKRFLSEVREGVVPQTYWSWKDVGSTRNAKQELSHLRQAAASQDIFVTPKPTKLIRRILEIATEPDSIVLDFFAGAVAGAGFDADEGGGGAGVGGLGRGGELEAVGGDDAVVVIAGSDLLSHDRGID